MRSLIALIIVFSLASGIAVAQEAVSSVEADLSGSGSMDTVTLVQRPHEILVSVRLTGSSGKHQVLRFGVDPGLQAALCKLPATLTVVPLDCSFQVATSALPACIESKRAQGIVLSGSGGCDSINLYGDHQSHRLAWWRN